MQLLRKLIPLWAKRLLRTAGLAPFPTVLIPLWAKRLLRTAGLAPSPTKRDHPLEQPVSGAPRRPLHPAVRDYASSIRRLSEEYVPSLFWERNLARTEAIHEDKLGMPLDSMAIETYAKHLFTGFDELDDSVRDVSEDAEFVDAAKLLGTIQKDRVRLTAAGQGVSKERWEHVTALDFLGRRNLLESYLRFISPLRIRSNMSIARHYFYRSEIIELIQQHLGPRRLNILEIGAGAGNLAYFLYLSGVVQSYWIVDLPEMLLNSGYTLSKFAPDEIFLFDEVEKLDIVDASTEFRFIVPHHSGRLPESTFDLCINMNSFSEMDQQGRDDYLELVYKVSRPKALFYNVNRRQRNLPQRDGTTFDNNPLLYPYRSSDRIVKWEEDAFQTATRGALGGTPSIAVTRAAIINS